MRARTTKIEWATDTANYLAGCNKVSPECAAEDVMKAHVITMLVVDLENVGAAEAAGLMESARYPNRCINPRHFRHQTIEIGAWSDDHPLNSRATDVSEWFARTGSIVLPDERRFYCVFRDGGLELDLFEDSSDGMRHAKMFIADDDLSSAMEACAEGCAATTRRLVLDEPDDGVFERWGEVVEGETLADYLERHGAPRVEGLERYVLAGESAPTALRRTTEKEARVEGYEYAISRLPSCALRYDDNTADLRDAWIQGWKDGGGGGRCPSTCPHGDRCALEIGHDGGHNHRVCDCNEPNVDQPDIG